MIDEFCTIEGLHVDCDSDYTPILVNHVLEGVNQGPSLPWRECNDFWEFYYSLDCQIFKSSIIGYILHKVYESLSFLDLRVNQLKFYKFWVAFFLL